MVALSDLFGGVGSSFTVQHISGSEGDNYIIDTISAVDLSKAILIPSFTSTSTGWESSEFLVKAEFYSTNKVRCSRGSYSGAFEYSVYVIESDSFNVQSIVDEIRPGQYEDTFNISSVDTSKSIIVPAGYRTAGNVVYARDSFATFEFANSSTVRVRRYSSDNEELEFSCFVVELG